MVHSNTQTVGPVYPEQKWTENTCMLVLAIHSMVYLECSLLRAQNASLAELAVTAPVCGCGLLEQ